MTETIYQENVSDESAYGTYDDMGADNVYLKDSYFIFGLVQNSFDSGRLFSILRFKIPFDLSDREITNAELQFRVRQHINPAPNSLYNGKVLVGLEDADNAAIPANRTDAITAIGNLTTATDELVYIDQLMLDGYIFVVENLKDALVEVMSRGGFSANNYVCIYLITTEPIPPDNVSILLYKTTVTVNGDFWPFLRIDYEYTTPGPGGEDRHVEDTFEIFQNITVKNMSRYMEDEVTIEQDIDYAIEYGRSVEDTLEIEQDIVITGNKSKAYEDFVNITQTISINREYYKTVEHFVDIDVSIVQDIIRNSNKDKQIIDELEVIQDIDVQKIYNRTIEDILEVLQDIHVSPMELEIIDSLTIVQTIEVTGIFANPNVIEDNISIEQDISYVTIRTRAIEDEVAITQRILARISRVNVAGGGGSGGDGTVSDSTYSPIYDESVNFPPEPTLVESINFSMSASNGLSGLGVIFQVKPLLGNREELQVTRIQRKSIDKDLITFSDADWPKVVTNRYKFDGFTDLMVQQYYEFLLYSLGYEVTLSDHEGQVWLGYVVTPEGETVDESGDTCHNTIEFDFIGVRQ